MWRVSLSLPRERVRRLQRTLSPDERRRARRFLSAHDADGFVVARGVLRSLLGRYLRCDPHSLEFSYGHGGKPELPAPASGPHLGFNLAHSGSVALIAVARGRRVGVDVEALRAVPEWDRIARHHFSARENRELRALAPDERHKAFLRGWTRKEALVKAIGAGLDHPVDGVEVPLAPLATVVQVTLLGAGESSVFTLRPVPEITGYAVALAVEDVVPRQDHQPGRNGGEPRMPRFAWQC